MKAYFQGLAQHVWAYTAALAKWLVLATITGTVCGLLGTAFHVAVELATGWRQGHPWMLWLLPLAGVAIVGIYKLTRSEGQNTNTVIEEVKSGTPLHMRLLPAIFISSVLTHLCGGSAGREGAALQMGGDIGYHAGRWMGLNDHDCRTATLCGMAAFFSALFGTPLAASLFAMMMIRIGVVFYAAFTPCFAASLVAYAVSVLLRVPPTHFTVAAPEQSVGMMVRVAILGVACAFVTILFCWVLHAAEVYLRKFFPNAWLKAPAGGAIIILLTLLMGSQRYNGAGMDVITAAIEQGSAQPMDWIWKILFTAITLGAGYKGGEVVPSFFIGATFGCVVGPLLGIPAGFAAAVGLIAVFCGASNCLISSIFLAIELFGSGGVLYYAVACGLSYVLSGYSGLYSSQEILTSKLASEYHTEPVK